MRRVTIVVSIAGALLFVPPGAVVAATESHSTAQAGAGPSAGAPVDTGRDPGLPADAPMALYGDEVALPTPEGWPFPEGAPRTSGTGRLLEGSFQWTDFIHDDYGPRGAINRSEFTNSATTGSYAYPAGPAYANNAADFFRVGVGIDEDNTYWRVDWNTLAEPTIPIAVFGLDTDPSTPPPTEPTPWAEVPNLRSTGVDAELVIAATGVRLVDTATRASRTVGDVTVDLDARSFVGRVPRETLDPSGAWRVYAVSGLADGDRVADVPVELGGLPFLPPVYNVAFRGHLQEAVKLTNHWREEVQADALLSGDVSPFGAEVDWDQLDAAVTTPEPRPTGALNRWYVSSQELGQGVVPQSTAWGPTDPFHPSNVGRVQPYFIYVPTDHDPARPTPLRFLLHALHANHNQYANVAPKFIQQACEQYSTICVTPLGRGPDGWYHDEAELDFWEVWRSVGSDFSLDPDRTSIAGYSMGGHGTSRMTHRYPDLFARAALLAGPVGDVPEIENLRWIPTMIAHGVADVGAEWQALAMVDRLDKLGYRYLFEWYLAQDHTIGALIDGQASAATYLGDHPRTVDPGHITYSWSPGTDRPDLGFAINGAYWIREVAARNPNALARFDANSSARPDPSVEVVRTIEPDLLGQSGAGPAIVRRLDWELGDSPSRSSRISLGIKNVGSATIRLARAGIPAGRRAELDISSDGPARLTLTDLRPGTRLVVDGQLVAKASSDGTATIGVRSGASLIQIEVSGSYAQ